MEEREVVEELVCSRYSLKEPCHDIFKLFFGSLKIVVNWRETFK